MAKRIKLQDRSGVQLLPLTRAELVQFTYITGLVPESGTLSVQVALEALNTKANDIATAEGTNLAAINVLKDKLKSFEEAQDSVKNYVNAQDTAYLALAYAEAAAKATEAQTNSYAWAEAKATAAETAAKDYADGKFLSKVKLNDAFVTVQSDETNGRYVDLGSIATSTGLQSLSDRVTAIEGTYITTTDSNNADTAIITAYEAADTAIINAYTAADSAIITAYEAADSALSDRIDDLESSYGVTVTETAGSGDILKGYQIAQNGVTLGTINIPKDMVATQGEVVYCTKSGDTYTEVASTTSGAIACIKMTVGNGNSTDSFYVEVADLIEYNGVQSNSEITLSDTGHVIEATVGAISSSKITFTPAGDNPTDTTVQAALRDLYSQIGAGGSVTTQIQTAIEALDASYTASGTAAHNGTFVMNAVTQADGVITSIGSVEVEAAGAAAAVQTTVEAHTINSKALSTNPVLDGRDINVDDSASTTETVAAAITRLTTADGNSVKKVNNQTPNANGEVTVDASQIDTVNTYKLSGDSSAVTHTVDAVLAEAVFFVDTTGAGTYDNTTI